MATTGRLVTEAQVLAALMARLRLADLGTLGDPAVAVELDRVADCLGVRAGYDGLTAEERSSVLNFAQSYLRQALDLIDDPVRTGAWTHVDPEILQAQGSASAVVATLIADAGIGREDARILDVGTGVAGLAIAFCQVFEHCTVVGIDPFETALNLARANVAAAGLARRITLRPDPVQSMTDTDGFDLVWFPTFFIPEATLEPGLQHIAEVTRPDGEVVLGVHTQPEDPLPRAVDALFSVRAGGSAIAPDDAEARLIDAGFVEVRVANPDADVPLQLVVGRQPSPTN